MRPSDICRVWEALVSAVESAHRKGIIHRDLKPQNFLLVPVLPSGNKSIGTSEAPHTSFSKRIRVRDDGIFFQASSAAGGIATTEDVRLTIKLADFGLARALDPESSLSNISIEERPVGTILYMAPETVAPTEEGQSKKLSHGVDVWALGVMLFQLLHRGRCPLDERLRKAGQIGIGAAVANEHFMRNCISRGDRARVWAAERANVIGRLVTEQDESSVSPAGPPPPLDYAPTNGVLVMLYLRMEFLFRAYESCLSFQPENRPAVAQLTSWIDNLNQKLRRQGTGALCDEIAERFSKTKSEQQAASVSLFSDEKIFQVGTELGRTIFPTLFGPRCTGDQAPQTTNFSNELFPNEREKGRFSLVPSSSDERQSLNQTLSFVGRRRHQRNRSSCADPEACSVTTTTSPPAQDNKNFWKIFGAGVLISLCVLLGAVFLFSHLLRSSSAWSSSGSGGQFLPPSSPGSALLAKPFTDKQFLNSFLEKCSVGGETLRLDEAKRCLQEDFGAEERKRATDLFAIFCSLQEDGEEKFPPPSGEPSGAPARWIDPPVVLAPGIVPTPAVVPSSSTTGAASPVRVAPAAAPQKSTPAVVPSSTTDTSVRVAPAAAPQKSTPAEASSTTHTPVRVATTGTAVPENFPPAVVLSTTEDTPVDPHPSTTVAPTAVGAPTVAPTAVGSVPLSATTTSAVGGTPSLPADHVTSDCHVTGDHGGPSCAGQLPSSRPMPSERPCLELDAFVQATGDHPESGSLSASRVDLCRQAWTTPGGSLSASNSVPALLVEENNGSSAAISAQEEHESSQGVSVSSSAVEVEEAKAEGEPEPEAEEADDILEAALRCPSTRRSAKAGTPTSGAGTAPEAFLARTWGQLVPPVLGPEPEADPEPGGRGSAEREPGKIGIETARPAPAMADVDRLPPGSPEPLLRARTAPLSLFPIAAEADNTNNRGPPPAASAESVLTRSPPRRHCEYGLWGRTHTASAADCTLVPLMQTALRAGAGDEDHPSQKPVSSPIKQTPVQNPKKIRARPSPGPTHTSTPPSLRRMDNGAFDAILRRDIDQVTCTLEDLLRRTEAARAKYNFSHTLVFLEEARMKISNFNESITRTFHWLAEADEFQKKQLQKRKKWAETAKILRSAFGNRKRSDSGPGDPFTEVFLHKIKEFLGDEYDVVANQGGVLAKEYVPTGGGHISEAPIRRNWGEEDLIHQQRISEVRRGKGGCSRRLREED